MVNFTICTKKPEKGAKKFVPTGEKSTANLYKEPFLCYNNLTDNPTQS